MGAIDAAAITTMATADDLWVPAESLSRTQEEVVLNYFDEGRWENELNSVVGLPLPPSSPVVLCRAAMNTVRYSTSK